MVSPDAMVKPDDLSGPSFFAAEYVTQRATNVSIENILMLNPLKTEQAVPTEYSMAAIRARGDAITFLMATWRSLSGTDEYVVLNAAWPEGLLKLLKLLL